MASNRLVNISRRKFLELCAAGTCGGAAHQLMNTLAPMRAFAAPLSSAATGPINTLIIVNFSGGTSYNFANPTNGTYLGLCPDTSFTPLTGGHPLDPYQNLHPSLGYFKTMFDAGDLAVMNLLGYDQPNYSHDESTNIMQLGKRYGSLSDGGWGTRLACQIASLFPAVALGGNPTLMQGACLLGQPGTAPTALGNIENFGVGDVQYSGDTTAWVNITLNNLLAAGGIDTPAYAFVTSEKNKFDQIVQVVQNATAGIALPHFNGLNGSFVDQCKDAAKLTLAQSLGVRLISLSQGGFDTHNSEDQNLPGLLTDINTGIQALVNTLIDTGYWDQTAICFISEFGRTFQNNNNGTDHGHGAPGFVAGGRVNGRVVNEAPNDAKCAAAAAASYRFENYEIHWWEVFRALVSAMGLSPDVIEPPTIVYSGLNLVS